ncbi:MAG: hypothetical protein QME94_07180 [Anaerolineae bacterium]|nr:hypothetical protein [Anaerolineae bacterium]
MRSRLQTLALALCLAGLIWPLAAQPGRADCGLNNNGFEGGFRDVYGDGHVVVANGWEFWFQDGPGQEQGRNFRPTFRGEQSSYLGGLRVHSGNWSQKFGNLYAAHNAGLYQRVSVPRDSQVTFTAWAQAWSSSGDDNYSVSEPGNYRLYVGIDPTGGTNWAANTVRWSASRMEYNVWVQLSVSARAEADAVTVFLRGSSEFPVKHNESCWDDACLTVVRPTPRPTNTPRPTSTPTITPTPTATPTPTITPTPVVSEICIRAFEDANGNRSRDAGEGAIPGAQAVLLDAEGVEVGDLLTVSYREALCFQDIPAGEYSLKLLAPAGYEASGAFDGSVTLGEEPVALEVGFRRFPTSTPGPTAAATATPQPTPTPPPSGGFFDALGRGLYGISGVLVALVALALPLGYRYFHARGRE